MTAVKYRASDAKTTTNCQVSDMVVLWFEDETLKPRCYVEALRAENNLK
jgi:hypothetical protein